MVLFEIIQTQKGKPCIKVDDHKYREAYTTKKGDVIWRCLGRTCVAKIKTNADKTQIIECATVHNGAHPVTMRTLSSPAMTCHVTPEPLTPGIASSSPAKRTLSPSTQHMSTPRVSEVLPFTPASFVRQSPGISVASSSVAAAHRIETPPADLLSTDDLIKENNALKQRVSELDVQRRCILDHAIESDLRLSAYTDEIFLPGVSPSTSTGEQRGAEPNGAARTVLTGEELDLQSIDNTDLLERMRTTIEVLEAEVKCLRSELWSLKTEAASCCCKGHTEDNWTLVTNKKKTYLGTQNKYGCLAEDDSKDEGLQENKITKNVPPKPGRKNKRPTNTGQQKKAPVLQTKPTTRATLPGRVKHPVQLNVPSVIIEGDSHVRHLAGLVGDLVSTGTKVTGMCKPGASLLSAFSCDPPPSGSCCVLMAGTNDVAAGRQDVVYENLERLITTRSKNGKVIVAMLPIRHDLPLHHAINVNTRQVNSYMEEICIRHGVEIIHVNSIRRGCFTRHGMHLRMKGKRLLAALILESLRITCGRSVQYPTALRQTPDTAQTVMSAESAEAVSFVGEPSAAVTPATKPGLPVPVSAPPGGIVLEPQASRGRSCAGVSEESSSSKGEECRDIVGLPTDHCNSFLEMVAVE